MEGANIYQLAKNCRTSVGMSEKYHAVHIKTSLGAIAINIVRSKQVRGKKNSELSSKVVPLIGVSITGDLRTDLARKPKCKTPLPPLANPSLTPPNSGTFGPFRLKVVCELA
jgi:hypothetical protein